MHHDNSVLVSLRHKVCDSLVEFSWAVWPGLYDSPLLTTVKSRGMSSSLVI